MMAQFFLDLEEEERKELDISMVAKLPKDKFVYMIDSNGCVYFGTKTEVIKKYAKILIVEMERKVAMRTKL